MVKALSPFLKVFLAVASLVAIAYTATCVYLFMRQTRMIFFPSPYIQTTPTEFNLPYEEVWIPVAEGGDQTEKIHGWWIPAQSERVLLYLHGNGSNIGANVVQASRFHQLGFSVLLIDYRGYGKSEGDFPTEASVYTDAQAAWDHLIQQGISSDQIFIYGHSLGGAIAINLATQNPTAAGLIVQSSFTSMREMATYAKNLEIFPLALLLTQRFDSLQKLQANGASGEKPLQMPVLFIHGSADTQVPSVMSEALYAAAPEPKQIWLVPEAGHNNVADVAGAEYLRVVRQFVERASVASLQSQDRQK
ncbi:alpha/beta fold hydrolase [Leptolyngbya sp. FACHB-541]|uniref:alpha/beta hydrolase n=1 Tax=Leptolyngbya sp. FACHB-541 TaxID=2692810 RepID=UPI0016822316|nr:alpha/beta fold hydrolase [Leptolyngbya sp. FACHB-541]MBD1998090.1 alpha/beta fold hydrolase [Leptolyngbya sp. FACHB-541]